MKKFNSRLIILFLFLSFGAKAQINHFIYLQTENKQPFYLKFNKMLLSSSAAGYLIVPKLREGNYTLTIGFPKNEWKEQIFNCTVAQEDVGYLLKNFNEKGWGLFHLQTLAITMAGNKIDDIANNPTAKADEFSSLLSSAVNDPALLVKNDATEKTKKDERKSTSSINEKEKKEKVKSELEKPINVDVKNSKQEDAKPVATILKIQDAEAYGGRNLVFLDDLNGKIDTITIFIPSNASSTVSKVIMIDTLTSPEVNTVKSDVENHQPEKKELKEASINEANNKKVISTKEKEPIDKINTLQGNTIDNFKTKNTPASPANEPLQKEAAKQNTKDEKFLSFELSPLKVNADSAKINTEIKSKEEVQQPQKIAITQAQANLMVNSDCIANASEDDFLKLRKKMAAATSEEEMNSIAKKALKIKCFSTEQIKNLGVLYLNDAGKYKFFDMAYPFVWDSFNYSLLENQIVDPYYTNRFKAMIRR